MIQIKKGLDLPISGAPEMQVGEPLPVSHVALLGSDYQEMKPTLLVAEGDQVVLGQPLFSDKKNPRVLFTAPAPGKVVAINRGDRDGLQAGDTLAIFKRGDLVKDRIASERIRLPDERIGLLMVFYTYEKMSFGLIMEADRQVDIGDLLSNP